LPGFLYEDR